MRTLFESREAAGVELYPRLNISADALFYAHTPSAVEVAYALSLRCGGELRAGLPSRDVTGREVWLVDDGTSELSRLECALAILRRLGADPLYLAVPVAPRGAEQAGLVDGVYALYVSSQLGESRLYRYPAEEPRWLVTSASASRAWHDRW